VTLELAVALALAHVAGVAVGIGITCAVLRRRPGTQGRRVDGPIYGP
jgi:hypothetical protein